MMKSHARLAGLSIAACGILLAGACVQPTTPGVNGSTTTLPTTAGFQVQTVATGLNRPTSVAFTPSGKMFVAEQSGLIKAYDSVADSSATVAIDLRPDVYDHADRGLLGLDVDPLFDSSRPYLYAIYSAEAPLFGDNPDTLDSCRLLSADGCVIRSKVVRIVLNPSTLVSVGQPLMLTNNYCQQFSGHSIADVKIGDDGALYASAGDGASFVSVDYGQMHGAVLANPCADPPTGNGTVPTPPTAEGGALRAQSPLTVNPGFTASFDGAVIRINPDTGAPWPTNPWVSDPDVQRAKILGYGFRNPFRLTIRPNTDDVWVSDVGWHVNEEINVIDPGGSAAQNFGWPCFEGAAPQPGYQAAGLNICSTLYNNPSLVSAPELEYSRSNKFDTGNGCTGAGGLSAAGLAFYEGGTYPASYDGGLFFSDYGKQCIWFFPRGTDGDPDPSQSKVLVRDANVVDLELGPGGDVFYVEVTGEINRLVYDDNGHPTARISASTLQGGAPITIELDGNDSTDPDVGDTLTYAWDLDNDGSFNDSDDVETSVEFTTEGVKPIRLKVTDSHGASHVATVSIDVGNQYPAASMDSPNLGYEWSAGSIVRFDGSAEDQQDGSLGPSAFSWELKLHHCTSGNIGECHVHPVQTWTGVDEGEFEAPEHDYPSYLELVMHVTDSQGNTVTTTRDIQPRTVTVTILSQPPGATVAIGDRIGVAPFTVELIRNSATTVLTPQTQTINEVESVFTSWSDGGNASHEIVPSGNMTVTANFAPASP